jgi:hypothetical protein
LSKPAISRYAATTPKQLNWFKKFNDGKPYRDQVKPCNFLYSLFADPLAQCSGKSKKGVIRPVAPYHKDLAVAVKHAFDRETGDPVPEHQLQTFAQRLAQYHLHPESKFLNGDYLDRGTTIRRHVVVTGIELIGKEANRWEEQEYLGRSEDAEITFGTPGNRNSELVHSIRELAKRMGQRELADRLAWSRSRVAKVVRGDPVRISRNSLDRARHVLQDVRQEQDATESESERALATLRERIETVGLYATAQYLNAADPSNLQKIATGKRRPTVEIVNQLLGGIDAQKA